MPVARRPVSLGWGASQRNSTRRIARVRRKPGSKSKNGGRGEDNGRSTIDALPEIIAATNAVDDHRHATGFRRGTDVVKALAMGAHAAGIGRPYLWGLGAFGQEGVERVLDLVRTETRAAMQQCGVRSVKELNPSFVRRAT
jgi:4-hydroxymandelate oxidase